MHLFPSAREVSRYSEVSREEVQTEDDSDSDEESDVYAAVDKLPSWAYPASVARLADGLFKDKVVPMRVCTGPAVRWAQLASFLTISVQIALFILAKEVSFCTEDHYVMYPDWLWYLYGPTILIHLAIEWCCLRYTLLPYVQVMRKLRILKVHVPFGFWLFFNFLKSVLGLMDAGTDTFFAAAALRSDTCPAVYLTELWSAMSNRYIYGAFLPNIVATIVIIWALTFIQVLWPIIETSPSCDEMGTVDYTVLGDKGDDPIHEDDYKFTYVNILGEPNMTLGDAIYNLADCNAMASITDQGLHYPRAKEKIVRLEAFKELCSTSKYRTNALGYLRNGLARVMSRILLIGLAENGLQIFVQVQIFTINRVSMEEKRVDYQTLMSISLSSLMALLQVFDAVRFLGFEREVNGAVVEHHHALRDLGSDDNDSVVSHNSRCGIEGHLEDSACELMHAEVRWYVRVIIVSALLLGGTIVCSLAKLVLSLAFCDEQSAPAPMVWDFGCVDLSAEMAAIRSRAAARGA